jgi:hypothetical protein
MNLRPWEVMTRIVLMDKLPMVLKASRPITWILCFILLGNGMLSSRAIPSTLVLQHVITQTFTFSIPFAISTCNNCFLFRCCINISFVF